MFSFRIPWYETEFLVPSMNTSFSWTGSRKTGKTLILWPLCVFLQKYSISLLYLKHLKILLWPHLTTENNSLLACSCESCKHTDMFASHLLSSCSSMIQTVVVQCSPDGGLIHLYLWVIFVGQPQLGKGTLFSEFLNSLTDRHLSKTDDIQVPLSVTAAILKSNGRRVKVIKEFGDLFATLEGA